LKHQDCVGCLNYYAKGEAFYGLLLMSKDAFDALDEWLRKSMKYPDINLKVLTDESIGERVVKSWGRGEHYYVYQKSE
jgi:hypothetical protein